MRSIENRSLLEVATAAAREAGQLLLKHFQRSRLSARRKFDYPGSIVTNADMESERLILSRIKRSAIKSTIDSEESGYLDFGSPEVVWAVDPLDGTSNFAKRIPYFAVSIGVLVRGRTTVGVIYNPILDEMFTAERLSGAYLNGKRIHLSKTRSLKDASLIFEWWQPEPAIRDPLSLARKLYRFTRSVRSTGCVALNLCSVASGRFDGLVTVFKKSPVYETAAGCLILKEAGGRITNSFGNTWEKFRWSLIAGNPHIQEQLLSVVRAERL